MFTNPVAAHQFIANIIMDYDQYSAVNQFESMPLDSMFRQTTFNEPSVDVSSIYRPSRRPRSNRQKPPKIDGFIWCKYCSNRMPEHLMSAHIERKHSNKPDEPSSKHRASKRSRNDDQGELNGNQIFKRQHLADDDLSFTPVDSRPTTPPTEDITHPIEQQIISKKSGYNLVHISDEELNRFMELGLIRIHTGQLYMKDTVLDQTNEQFEPSDDQQDLQNDDQQEHRV